MTPELEKVKRITDNYIALKKAIDNPNYPSTAHTQAALLIVVGVSVSTSVTSSAVRGSSPRSSD